MFLLEKRYRDIIYFKAGVHLRSEASKTYLSIFWWVLEPALMMAVYYFVFSVLLDRRTPNFTAFLLVGLICWQWLVGCLSSGMNSVDGNAGLISQLKFPKIILPSVVLVVDTFKFGIVFLLLCIFLWIRGNHPTHAYFALLPLLVTQFVFLSALTYLLALGPAFLPDLKVVIPLIIRAGLFLSGIFYDFRTFDAELQIYFLANPMALLLEMYRQILLLGELPDFEVLGLIFAASFLVLLLAHALFRRCDPVLPRLLAER